PDRRGAGAARAPAGAQRARDVPRRRDRRGQRPRAPRCALPVHGCSAGALPWALALRRPRARLGLVDPCRQPGRAARRTVALLELLARPAGTLGVAADPGVGVVGRGLLRRLLHLGLAVLAR